MSEQRNEETISDPAGAAAKAARAELDARAEQLRASGWIEPVEDRRCLIIKNAASDEQRLAHRRAVIARARKLVARLHAQQRERVVYKTYTPPPTEPVPRVPPVSPVKPTKGGYDRFMEKQDAELRERLQLSEADIQHRQRLSRDARALWDARRVNKLEQAMSDTPSTISRMDVATTEAWRAWFTEGLDLHFQNAFQNFICPEIRRVQSEYVSKQLMEFADVVGEEAINELRGQVAALRDELAQLRKEHDGYAG